MIDHLRQLAIFAKVVDRGSFRGAAHELHLSPSVISHHISALEEHLGVALIYRSTRKLALSPEGERLLLVVRDMLASVEDEISNLSTRATEPGGHLRLTAPSVLIHSRLTKSLAHFSTLYPRVRLSLDFSDSRRDLIEDGFDLAIRMGVMKGKKTTSRKLFGVDLQLVASKNYLSRHPQVVEPAQLEALDWLILESVHTAPFTFTRGAETVKVKPRKISVSTNEVNALYRLAAGSAGVATVPGFLAKPDIDAGKVRAILPQWSVSQIDVFAEWPANAPKSGLIHLLLKHLQQASFKPAPLEAELG